MIQHTEIRSGLHQFATTIPGMGLTIHQYLLTAGTPVLFATGTVDQARQTLPLVRDVLGGRALAYILVSHVESDECGGLGVFAEAYPQAKVLCSKLAARELPGYGFAGPIEAVDSKNPLVSGSIELTFVDYPSEVHLQNGIVALERKSGVLYSSDLFLGFGECAGQVRRATWDDEVAAIDAQRIPNDALRAKMQEELLALSPAFVAVGHGTCIECA